MKPKIIGGFHLESDLLRATRAARDNGWHIVDVHTPYPVHGLVEAMGLRPSRLPWVCLAFGLLGTAFAFWFQYWVMAKSWPTNVGGKPFNSWPAFVPVAFELMVLLAGFGVVFAFFFRCRLRPGKRVVPILDRVTDNQFALVIEVVDVDSEAFMIRECLYENNAFIVEEHDEGIA